MKNRYESVESAVLISDGRMYDDKARMKKELAKKGGVLHLREK